MIRAAWVEAAKYVFNSKAFVAGFSSMALIEVSWSRFIAPGWFTFTLLLLSTLELATCFYGKNDEDRRAFGWEKHIIGKLMIASIAIVALILDSIIVTIVNTMPEHYSFPLLGSGFLPITLGALIWLNTAEGIRVLNNVRRSQGDSVVPPIMRWFLEGIRKTDEARYHAVLGKNVPDTPPPPHRWYDNLTDEEIEDFIEHLKNQPEKHNPPPPGV